MKSEKFDDAVKKIEKVLANQEQLMEKVTKVLEKDLAKHKPGNILDQIYDKLGPKKMCLLIAEKQTDDFYKQAWIDRSTYKTYSLALQDTIKKGYHKCFSQDLEGGLK